MLLPIALSAHLVRCLSGLFAEKRKRKRKERGREGKRKRLFLEEYVGV